MQVIKIDKDQIAELPQAQFNGSIFIIDTMSKMKMAVTALQKESIIGFDTETKPAFKKGANHKVALLQLSSHEDCFLFRLNKIGIPPLLKEFLENESQLKVGLSLRDDFSLLRKLSSISPKGFIDLQSVVKDYNIQDISLQKIYAILFDERISKGQRLTNWEAPSLTEAQQHYASLDAWACIRIYEFLKSGKFNPLTSKYLTDYEDAL